MENSLHELSPLNLTIILRRDSVISCIVYTSKQEHKSKLPECFCNLKLSTTTLPHFPEVFLGKDHFHHPPPFIITGVWTQACCLLDNHSTTWTTPLAIFLCYFFSHSILLFAWCQPWTVILLPMTSEYRHAPPWLAVVWDGDLLTFCSGWLQTVILLISAS
jgi:hypothetical protein